MTKKEPAEQNPMKSSAQPAEPEQQVDWEAKRRALFAGLLRIQYPMAQDSQAEAVEQSKPEKKS